MCLAYPACNTLLVQTWLLPLQPSVRHKKKRERKKGTKKKLYCAILLTFMHEHVRVQTCMLLGKMILESEYLMSIFISKMSFAPI